jgi:hypothetical protein
VRTTIETPLKVAGASVPAVGSTTGGAISAVKIFSATARFS